MKRLILLLILICGPSILLSMTKLIAYDKSEVFVKEIDPIRLEREMQRIATAIDQSEYDIDTLDIRADTMAIDLAGALVDIDTISDWVTILEADLDTAQTDISLLQTTRDSVFFAYNANAFNVTAASTERVSLPTEIIEAGIYWHSDSSAVACNSAGYYSIDFALSLDKPTVASASASIQKYSSGWSIVSGSSAYAEGADYKSLAGCVVVQLTSSDSLALAVTNGAAGDDLPVIATTARMRIMKLH